MSILSLIHQFHRWQGVAADLVLATVVETEGHTYSKPGTQMLIAGDRYQGMVSGGCLEGDVFEHARQVFQTGIPKILSYDLRVTPENELIGLGVGCEGQISLLLQKLAAARSYEPFQTMAQRRLGFENTGYLLVVESGDKDIALGTTLLFDEHKQLLWGDTQHTHLLSLVDQVGDPVVVGTNTCQILCGHFKPLPRLLVLGAGLDAQPLVQWAVSMGWLVTVSDNRPALLQQMHPFEPEKLCLTPAAQLGSQLDLSIYDAAVIMSHHLDKDRDYLRTICHSAIPYVGLLGPVNRGKRLLRELNIDSVSLAGRLRSPIGLDIGANSPETIALSIMSELQAVAQGRDGAPLTRDR